MSSLLTLAAFVAANFAAASSGAIFQPGAWYESLRKPSWTPPNWAFPVVWTILFLMNAIAGWLVWEAEPANRLVLFLAYGISLGLNALWSAIFFGMRRMDLALAEVGALWVSIAAVAIMFAFVKPLAALLIAPYLAWVTVAAALNFRMMQLNPRKVREAAA